jgi:hypothetical protein
MDISIKGFYSLIMINIFVIIMAGMLVMNINNHYATKVVLSIVSSIQEQNELTPVMMSNFNELAANSNMKLTIEEINLEGGIKYIVRVEFTSLIGVLKIKKKFVKSKTTQVIYRSE